MRLGLGSFAYAWSIGVEGQIPAQPMTASDLVQVAADMGVHLIQIGDNLPLHTLSEETLGQLQRLASQHGVAVQVGTRGIDVPRLRQYGDIAQRFGSTILRTVIDTTTHHPDIDEVVTTWKPFIPELEARGLTLAVENHDRFKARELVHLLQRLDSEHFGVCLDTVNSFGALEGPEVVVTALAPWTVSLHVKDFAIGRANHNMGFVLAGSPAGQGVLDIPWLLEILRAHGRDPDAIIELWPPPEGALSATIAKEQRWAQESVAYMRQQLAE